MKPIRLPGLLALNAYWVGLAFLWNGLHVIVLPSVLLNYAPEGLKNTYLGLLTFTGLVIAMFIQPVSGALSDRWISNWGRRRPLILIGTLFDFVFLAILGWFGGLPWLVIGYFGLQVSSNLAHGPMQGLMPDQVPPSQLGAGSSIKNLMDMLGLILSSLFLGRLMDPNAVKPTHAIAAVMLVLATSAAITLLGTHEKPALPPPGERRDGRRGLELKSILVSIGASIRHMPPDFAWLLRARFIFLLGIYGIQSFAQYYIRDVLRAPDPPRLTGDLLATITLSLIVFALLGGWLGDRFGHVRMHYLAGGISGAGCALLLLVRSPGMLLVFGSVVGVGIGLFLTANWALATLLAPAEESGKYLGLTNLATAGAGATGRLLGPLIDLGNNAFPGSFTGYAGLFVFAALCSLASVLIISRVSQRAPAGSRA
jgi:MFS family permease